MKSLDITLAADFLVMAATLIEIKSKMLLPRDPTINEEDEFEDPRQELVDRLLDATPTLKPQMTAATWVGQRRWDLAVQTGETIALPEGQAAAATALAKFAEKDKAAGLLGRGILWFDLRKAGQITARLPRKPGEPILPPSPSES